jgi:hypothetical protein
VEQLNLAALIKIVGDLGLIGLILFLKWYDDRRIWKVMDQYKADMVEQREMYKANASLCRDYESIATDLRDIVTLNIESMTKVLTAVQQNQFCPLVRLDDRKVMNIAHLAKEQS